MKRGAPFRRLASTALLAVPVIVACLLLPAARLPAAEPAQVPDAVVQEVDRLVADLDRPEFAARNQAAARLEDLAAQRELNSYLSGRFRAALLAPETSFEVRSRLESLLRALPPVPPGGPKPNADQIAPLLDELSSDSYAQRDSALRRLEAMLAHVELIAPLWLELKRRAADLATPASARRALEPLVRKTHEAWLLADAAAVPLPQPPPQQIELWIADFARLDEFQPAGRDRRTAAQRELLDLLARDDTRDAVLAAVSQKIAADGDSAAKSPLEELVDFTRPGMVAEVWSNHALRTVQYLAIDVPQYNDAAVPPRATHFDRIDDQTAHCVSGNSLTEGDYPVRVAIPHPEPGHPTMFYLTNLPTARRRLAYEYRIQREPAVLLAEITDRTLNYYLSRQTPLAENEILLLAQLDPRGVSRFVGHYFEAVPNAGLISTPGGLNGETTVHAGVCAVISRIGTSEAVPALERLARSGALGKPNFESRLDVAWIAALAIAQRDPWPELDDWLARLIDERAPLTADPDRPPELGASAAGLLLDRHGASTRPFGLELAGEAVTESLRFSGYRFSSEQDRQDVKRWWKKQQAIATAARAANLREQSNGGIPGSRIWPARSALQPTGQ
jgi:hypothetical protein